MRIAESLACFFDLLRTIVRMLSNQTRAKNTTAIPHARLFGKACSARKRIKTQATVSLYRLLGICAYGASGKIKTCAFSASGELHSFKVFSYAVIVYSQTERIRRPRTRRADYLTFTHSGRSYTRYLPFRR